MQSDSGTDERTRFLEQLKRFDTAMLVTHVDGRLRSRPMAVAEVGADGRVTFATSIASPKVDELAADAEVNVAMQSATHYLSLTGRGRVVRDRALIERLWSEAWKVWFPKGKDDPDLCLIQVDPEEGEFWDQSGGKGLRMMWAAAKAYVTGTKVDDQNGVSPGEQHAKVRL